MTAYGLEKSDLGKNRFYSALNMPYQNGKIIGLRKSLGIASQDRLDIQIHSHVLW